MSRPLFSPLVNGERFPILNVYENFGYIDLLVSASDVDRDSLT